LPDFCRRRATSAGAGVPPEAKTLTPASPPRSVSIRPDAAILSVLKHLNYKPWYALAEFVDNAIQSYLQNRDVLHAERGPNWRLRVDIDVDASEPTRIRLLDNAAGISLQDFPRAFRPAVVPPDSSGLSEFGMGMKSAACWFAPRWQVRTQALGDVVARSVRFDVECIVRDSLEDLAIGEGPGKAGGHFTEVILEEPFHLPVGRTLGKIKEHLTDIYRCYLQDRSLVLRVNGQELAYDEPQVLRAPYYREPNGAQREWRKEIDLDLGAGQRARGFAALRQDGKGARAGFALFRRNRLIQGSGDEGWKHNEVFGAPNMYRHQRLFGELHLEGFEVSHTKDGFRWTDEDAFAQLLADELDSGDLPLLKQAEGHRQRAPRLALQRNASAAVAGTQEDMQANLESALPPAAEQARAIDPTPELADDGPGRPIPLADAEMSFEFWGSRWVIAVRVADADAQNDWLEFGDLVTLLETGTRRIEIRVAGAHPFMTRFAHRDPEVMQALVRVAAAMALSEALLRSTGAPNPGAIRRTTNDLLRDVFSTT